MWINSWVFKLYCFIKDTKTNCGEIYKTKYLEKVTTHPEVVEVSHHNLHTRRRVKVLVVDLAK